MALGQAQPQTRRNASSCYVSSTATGSPQRAWEPRPCSGSLGRALAVGEATPPLLPACPTKR